MRNGAQPLKEFLSPMRKKIIFVSAQQVGGRTEKAILPKRRRSFDFSLAKLYHFYFAKVVFSSLYSKSICGKDGRIISKSSQNPPITCSCSRSETLDFCSWERPILGPYWCLPQTWSRSPAHRHGIASTRPSSAPQPDFSKRPWGA